MFEISHLTLIILLNKCLVGQNGKIPVKHTGKLHVHSKRDEGELEACGNEGKGDCV